MGLNLEPRLDALESTLERGALLRIDRDAKSLAATVSVTDDAATIVGSSTSGQLALQFQFNPETVTRTRAGQWDPRVKRQEAKIPPNPEVRGTATMGSSALLAESETIGFKIVFDATEAVLAGRPHGTEQGVLPQLAFLELVSQGREGNVADDPKKQDKAKEVIQPIRPDELLLILGSARIFPVVLTNLTITEQKFLPSLVPLRAEVELKFTVLEPIESRYSAMIGTAFSRLTERRSAAAQQASSASVVDAIWKALNPQ
ncbi:hypothetical protein MMAG44476_04027 [Mycolicibacterium mageritense DSM 44476 = CIP 104973]|uniref:Contractile injection system tube protein N-terminal domain-containing protein n=1 Tax=Mycolicibacterium mageritense TaxID=53462 RepID=A0AAI8TY55_MYCME|nr:hypothetical protein [Mycolicibacterium mageritense]BBX36211.1 hypothetical protein MMAGJ_54930 [Mycolicibacterium mageritense]BDY31036.1 hypothetical protein hbim_04988 [Mycolicibacterium mageritense]GJJ17351.1 hypothetical protein MTY414_10240 [Mycolicibacterium mageritense]CDO24323.1 hypothetical protein BN978_04819 [Mycolicibacterium mageritense DSM 44476 = CIP 104973]